MKWIFFIGVVIAVVLIVVIFRAPQTRAEELVPPCPESAPFYFENITNSFFKNFEESQVSGMNSASREFSIRFVGTDKLELWDDQANVKVDCPYCTRTFIAHAPTDVVQVKMRNQYGSLILGRIMTTGYPIV